MRDETQHARFLSTARRSQGDMARLVGNLLSVARLDAGSQRYNIAPLPVEWLCAKIQDKYEDTLELSGVELDVSAEAAPGCRQPSPYSKQFWPVFKTLVKAEPVPGSATKMMGVGQSAIYKRHQAYQEMIERENDLPPQPDEEANRL